MPHPSGNVKERGPGRIEVAIDLADQGLGRRKAALVPELADEAEPDDPAVKVAPEAQEMRFDAGRIAAEGGPDPDVGQRGEGPSSYGSDGQEDSRRKDLVAREKVRRRKAQGAAPGLAGYDPALELVERSEQSRGFRDLPFEKEPADEAGTDGLTAPDDGSDGGDAEPGLPPEGGEVGRSACPSPAEPEIRADDDLPGPQSFRQDPLRESPAREREQASIEGDDEDAVDPGPAEPVEALVKGLDERDVAAGEGPGRMGEERQDERPQPISFRQGGQPGQDPPVADMQAVEVPYGQSRSPPGTGEAVEPGVDLHPFTS